jgi:hypothetical protein
MKLYTEEQLKKAIICTRNEYPIRYVQDIINDLKTIKLPSKDEIFNIIEESNFSLEYDTGFNYGIEWLINYIKKQDNAQI